MESGLNWEQNPLINELIQGMELAKQLRAHLGSASSAETRELLIQRILSSFEKALTMLNWTRPQVGNPQSPAPTAALPPPESCISGDGSPRSDECDRGFKDHQEQNDVSKKRKILPTWTDQVRVCSENGLEGPTDDGYSWRKYGQKDILGAKYPRSYYRCTHRHAQDCWATKQVQRSDDDPTLFEIIYRGKHTCNQNLPTAPSVEKQEMKQSNLHNTHHQNPPNNLLFDFKTNLRVNTGELNTTEMNPYFTFPSTSSQNPFVNHDNILEGFSPSFIAPATPETGYFLLPPSQMNSFGVFHNLRHSESDLTDIISANTSATNSPIVDLDFSIDPLADLDPKFPFNYSGFSN